MFQRNIEKPDERFKRMILERLNDAQIADGQLKNKEFCRHTKNFMRMMKGYMDSNTIDLLEKKMKEHEDKLAADIKDKSKADTESITIKTEYTFYDGIQQYGIDALRNSRIMQREAGGIILAFKNMEDLKKEAIAIKEDKRIQEVEETESEETDVPGDEE